MTSTLKMTVLFLIGCLLMATITALPFDRYSREDDERLNEVSGEWFRKPILRLDRLFSSAERPSESRKSVVRPTRNDKAESTESSKHAHSMITTMLGFVNSAINFGRSFLRD
ncbi:hypothetical protein KR074_001286 [Drosophila pseudoananassae]|nr:hypothetical protein KR074_001286 [Drosophila pseudoananassae]